ncbi:hypothetical protein IJF89_01130 [Candidatus Saccharibacteria bacterium]|nr:hypothetical protein [Candidatus Saccharibacteria bacterium]
MQKGVIFSFFYRFPSFFCSLVLFGLCALAGLNRQLNLTLPKDAKVRDKVTIASAVFEPATKLDIRTGSTNISSSSPTTKVPATSYSTPASYATSGFSIVNPAATTSSSYISPSETRVLNYKSKFFFGHSTGPLNWVKSASTGDILTVIRGGITERYQIIKKQTLPLASVQTVYLSISESASYRGATYDLALMTCGDGTFGSHGNDNNYRTFLFANRI